MTNETCGCTAYLFNDCLVVQLDVKSADAPKRGWFGRHKKKKKEQRGKVFVLSMADCRVTCDAARPGFEDTEGHTFKLVKPAQRPTDTAQLVMLEVCWCCWLLWHTCAEP